MNPVVKAQLKQFREANPISVADEADYFELYSIFSIVNGLRNDNIDPFNFHLKGKEFGIDGCGIIIQGDSVIDSDSATAAMSNLKDGSIVFTFFQAKRTEGYDYGDLSKFFDAVYGFFNGTMRGESPQLDDLIAAQEAIYSYTFRKNPELHCYFVSTGKYEAVDRIEKLISASEARLEALNIFSVIKIHTIGAKELQTAYRSATSANAREFEFSQNNTLPPHPAVDQAFIGFIQGGQLLKLATTTSEQDDSISINQSVFFDNIRDFNEDSSLNKKIIDEIKSGNTKSFIFKNNGVTVVAKKINRTGDRFYIEDYQIVNGCQTSNILFRAKDMIGDIHIPFRLIGSKDDEFVTSIIIGTNSQNAVKEEQFWALKPFMKDLEEYFLQQEGDYKLYLERRENQYRNNNIERTRIIKTTDLMKVIAAIYLFQPHRAARDFRGIRSDYSDIIFQNNHDVIPYHHAAYASYKFDYLIRNKKIDRAVNIYKYYIIYKIGYLSTSGQKIFELKSSMRRKACDDIMSIVSDEEKYIDICEKISTDVEVALEARLGGTGNNISREKIRDALRSDNFINEFNKI